MVENTFINETESPYRSIHIFLLVHMINKYKIYIRVHQSLKIKDVFCSRTGRLTE